MKNFSEEELNELRNYNAIRLPQLQKNAQEFIDPFDNEKLNMAEDFYNFASSQSLQYNDGSKKRYIKGSIMNTALLFKDNEHLKVDDFSEDDLLHHLWQFTYV